MSLEANKIHKTHMLSLNKTLYCLLKFKTWSRKRLKIKFYWNRTWEIHSTSSESDWIALVSFFFSAINNNWCKKWKKVFVQKTAFTHHKMHVTAHCHTSSVRGGINCCEDNNNIYAILHSGYKYYCTMNAFFRQIARDYHLFEVKREFVKMLFDWGAAMSRTDVTCWMSSSAF